ncbi:bifunctional riboflavin kinase/FAD synthetase [Acuticoccus mangrovi]|uniref:Riboflavin biosynthesis protein n=1 Tax=Acuticoccus mangrovi TaxID=2796142 RepID=A0A934MIX9_9HYPH|nr:bifunctional riboflavin kinase/FAD synthetase [Acuticoccus mangrovi]MBJ3777671.1 bifunctional riboflavin kinase/FAD synthetase [Acuticoccus mangrovi]
MTSPRSTLPFSVALDDLPPSLKGGTVAIGNFDGVHRGHQAVLARALTEARPALALTFEPHPRTFFGRGPLFRLTPPAVKARVMAALGLDALVVARFDAHFAGLTAEGFVREILVERLGARTVVVGDNFNFGAGRAGDTEWLAAAAASYGFRVDVVEGVGDADEGIVSSSRIRKALAAGELDGAATLLGYRYTVEAEVVHGEKRGRTIGFPTANQALGDDNGLRNGIYAVRAKIDDVWRDGVASFGRRPTFDNGAPLLETFVFDYQDSLYGRTMPVTFVRFLRPELKFDGVDALVTQMHQDAADARASLADLAPLSPLDRAVNF